MFITKSDLEIVLLFAKNGLVVESLILLRGCNSEKHIESHWDNTLEGMTAKDRDGGRYYKGVFYLDALAIFLEFEIVQTVDEFNEIYYGSFRKLAPDYRLPEVLEEHYWILDKQSEILAKSEKERVRELDERGVPWRDYYFLRGYSY